MKGPLFRPEAVHARRDRSLGVVALDAPAGARRLALAVLALAGLLAALLAFGRWTPWTPVAGEVIDAGGRQVARLRVPARAVETLAPGDELALRIDAWPDARVDTLRGHVVSIEPAGGAGGERVFYVLVAPAPAGPGTPVTLVPGMTVRAAIAGAAQPLYRWLFVDAGAEAGR